jgi:hypothetical protein
MELVASLEVVVVADRARCIRAPLPNNPYYSGWVLPLSTARDNPVYGVAATDPTSGMIVDNRFSMTVPRQNQALKVTRGWPFLFQQLAAVSAGAKIDRITPLPRRNAVYFCSALDNLPRLRSCHTLIFSRAWYGSAS